MSNQVTNVRIGPDQFLVFLHMPKTGGRSVTRLLQQVFGDSLCPHKQWNDVVANRDHLHRYRAVRGHLFATTLGFVTGSTGAALFRDPVDRVISEYRFIRRNPDHGRYGVVSGQSLLEFVSDPGNLKVYCRFLGFRPERGDLSRMRQTMPDSDLVETSKRVIDKLGFVGITEEFDLHYRRLEHWLGVDPAEAVPKVNVDPGQRPTPDGQIVDRIREVGWMDVAIYEYARSVAERS